VAGVLCLSACVAGGGSHPVTRRVSQATCGVPAPSRPPATVSTPSAPEGPRFVDATARSGLEYCQGRRATAPHCRFNPAALRRTFPSFDASGATFAGQDACTPERQSGGVAVGDYDGDGRPDVYVTRLDGPGLLFRNVGGGRFVDVTKQSGLASWNEPSNGAGWADLDNDGAQDLVVTPLAGHRLAYFHNDGSGHFHEEGVARGLALAADAPRVAESVNFGDYDGDGYLDVHVTEWRMFDLGRVPTFARLLHNRGRRAPGTFEDVTASAGADLALPGRPAWSFASAFADLDGDGRPDLYVAGDFGTSRLLWNDGAGHFTDGTRAAAVGTEENAMGLTVADYDGDGRPDVFVSSIYDPLVRCEAGNCNHGGSGNRLFRNLGGRRFADVTDHAGVRDGGWGWGAAFVDTTNVGRPDLVEVSGVDLPAQRFPQFLAGPTYAWRNRGDGTFAPMGPETGLVAPGPAKGLATLDADGDGRLDLLVVRDGRGPVLYLNRTPARRAWLGVRLVGTRSNRDGLGAVVEVQARAGGPVQRVEYGSVTHLLGQSELTAHFGLGQLAGPVARVRVRWPAGGRSELRAVRPGRVVTVREPRA
jgi:hypothetical protein